MLRRILVALTGTPGGEAAVRQAIELAQRHDAKVTGVTLIDPRRVRNVGSVPIGASAVANELRDHREAEAQTQMDQATESFRAACEATGVVHRVDVEAGDPCTLLLSLSRYHDLLVFGVPGMLAFGHPCQSQGLMAPLVNAGVRPLLAVAPDYRPVRRVMIAYSGSRESAKTMRRFAQMDPWPDVHVDIVTFQSAPDVAEQLLGDAAEYCRDHGFETSTAHSDQPPKTGILSYASEHDIDLIVMGYSMRGQLRRKLMGETGLHVLRQTDRPVFLSQ